MIGNVFIQNIAKKKQSNELTHKCKIKKLLLFLETKS